MSERLLTTKEILQLHEDLELKYSDGDGGDFLCGWQSVNPFADGLLAAVKKRKEHVDYTKYFYMETDVNLASTVVDLHAHLDRVAPEAAFCAACGGASALSTFCYWLARHGVTEVYYIPPIYFTLLNGLRRYGIRAHAVSKFHSFEQGCVPNLPRKETVLVLADPVWYAGISVPQHIVDAVSVWQKKTKSLVFVDGSFQYMRWDARVYEPTAQLDLKKTLRLVCPTKSLVIHGYRFAYVLMPIELKPTFSNSYTNLCGSAAADNVVFAHEAVDAMAERTLTEKLIERAAERHKRLRRDKIIESPLAPNVGYFVFEKINIDLPKDTLKMQGDYFGQPRFPEHTRMNLLSTKFHLLEGREPLSCIEAR
jgi:aspartate/methionine/tyrosine aminotransferase